ncbi:MAG: TRAP transporter large permease subunit [Spirochaetales bacterium]|nr:TRAP transporter large permease subunit [Spirochaetales bacterium]
MSLLLNILIIIIAVAGAPLFAVLGLFSIFNFHFSGGSLLTVAQEISSQFVSMPLLASIPLFTFAGYMLASGTFSQRLIRFVKNLVGWLPGGLAIVTLIVCAFFTVFTGASGVTIIALGGVLFPALLKEKYNERFSLGLVTTSGSLGLLFPPSLPLILYGVTASANIDQMFVAGIVPGIVLIVVLSIYSMAVGIADGVERTKFDGKELLKSAWDLKWEIPLPILLVAGVYTGNMALSDAAPFTVAYVFIVEVLILKEIKWHEMPEIIKRSMVIIGAILLIMSISFAGSNYIIYNEIPQKMFNFMQQFITSKYVFLILLNIFLLIVGCIMDIFTAIMIIVPLIAPIAYQYNVDLIHLGVIFLANLEIGYLTPPVGMNLFISSMRFKKPVVQLYGASVKFIGLLLIALVLITYIPWLSTWFIEKPSIVGKWEYVDETLGTKDELILKAGGMYLRKKSSVGDFMALLQPYTRGYYQIERNKLILEDVNSIQETFNFEIYNGGKRLLIETENVQEEQEVIDANGEMITVIPERQRFYENQLPQPLSENKGKVVGVWVNSKKTLNFEFDNTIIVNYADGNQKSYLYEVKKNHILIKDSESGNFDILFDFIVKYPTARKLVLIDTETKEQQEFSLSFEE